MLDFTTLKLLKLVLLEKNISNMSSKIFIRQIQKFDEGDLFNLRNLPEIHRCFINSNKIDFDEHKNWVHDRSLNCPELTLVALNEDELIGLCYLKFISQLKFEISIHIKPNFQNIGIGSSLVSELLFAANEKNIKIILATIDSDNKQSINFFRKHGFIKDQNQNNEKLILDKRSYISMKLQLY